jgi:hypothetical protein
MNNGELLFSLYFRYYTQTFFVTRLIINKVQWVDLKLENVLVSLHSLNQQSQQSPLNTIEHKKITWSAIPPISTKSTVTSQHN